MKKKLTKARMKAPILAGALAIATALGLLAWRTSQNSEDVVGASTSVPANASEAPASAVQNAPPASGSSAADDTAGKVDSALTHERAPAMTNAPTLQEKRSADGTRVYTQANGDVVTVTTSGEILLLPKEL